MQTVPKKVRSAFLYLLISPVFAFFCVHTALKCYAKIFPGEITGEVRPNVKWFRM